MKIPRNNSWGAPLSSICQEYLRAHADDLPVGRPIPYEEFCRHTRPKFIMRPGEFEFSGTLFNSQGLEVPIFSRLSHVFTGVDARFYARSRIELLAKGESPLFLQIKPGSMPLPVRKPGNAKKRLGRPPYSPAALNRMARFVWDSLLFLKSSALKHAFSLVMSVLECRLMLDWVVGEARSGRLPKRWTPYCFSFEKVRLDLEGLTARSSFLVPSPKARSRFRLDRGIEFCIPIYSRISGLFARILEDECIGTEVALTLHLPAYFVFQDKTGWKAYFSNTLNDDVDCACSGRGSAAGQFDVVSAGVNQHLVSMLLGERTSPNGIMIDVNTLGKERYFAIHLVRMTRLEQVHFYESLLDEFNKRLDRVFAAPQKFLAPKPGSFDRELDIKVYGVMKAAYEEFFGGCDGHLAA